MHEDLGGQQHKMKDKADKDKEKYDEMVSGEKKSPLQMSIALRITTWIFAVLIIAVILYFVFIF